MKKDATLWEFCKSGSSRSHYILGTMHVRSEKAYVQLSRIKRLMEQCHYYAGELNLSDPRMEEIHKHYIMPEGKRLIDILGEKQYDKMARIVSKSFGIDLDNLAGYRPMIISNIITESIISGEYDIGLDHFLWRYAMSMDMHMVGLESFDDQVKILNSIPMDVQIKGLKKSLKNVRKYRKTVLELLDLYESGALTKLYKKTKKSMGGIRSLMIYDRNHTMASRLLDVCQEGSVFCAVGAGHLPGKKGMLRIIKKSGYKVKPLYAD